MQVRAERIVADGYTAPQTFTRFTFLTDDDKSDEWLAEAFERYGRVANGQGEMSMGEGCACVRLGHVVDVYGPVTSTWAIS